MLERKSAVQRLKCCTRTVYHGFKSPLSHEAHWVIPSHIFTDKVEEEILHSKSIDFGELILDWTGKIFYCYPWQNSVITRQILLWG